MRFCVVFGEGGASRLIPGGLPPPRTPPVISRPQAARVKATGGGEEKRFGRAFDGVHFVTHGA